MIAAAVRKAFERAAEQGWWELYIGLDIHGVIFESTLDKKRQRVFLPGALECLQYLSQRRDIKIFLYSCSKEAELLEVSELLKANGVKISEDFNKNRDVVADNRNDYKSKPYFNLFLDDKAGFEASEWLDIWEEFKKHQELPTEFEVKSLNNKIG